MTLWDTAGNTVLNEVLSLNAQESVVRAAVHGMAHSSMKS